MKRVSQIVAGFLFVGMTFVVRVDALQAPNKATTTSTTSTTSTSTSTTLLLPPEAKCGQWWVTAQSIGFDEQLMLTLDDVMFRESRCDASQINASDPNGGSIGLVQVNRFWCLPSKYYPNGYLQSVNVLSTCDELFDPIINLRSALALINYSTSAGHCEWQQWAWVQKPCEND